MVPLANVTGMIEAPMEAVWAVLSDFARPQRLAPSIDRCTVSGSGVGAIRIVESSRGLRIHERLLECDSLTGRLRYDILPSGDMPFAHVTSYECTVTVTRRADGATAIEWASVGDVDGPVEPVGAFLDALYRQAIERIRAEVA